MSSSFNSITIEEEKEPSDSPLPSSSPSPSTSPSPLPSSLPPGISITLDLIRKKSDHLGTNRLLSQLEEISLHQLNILTVGVLPSACPNLQILYLQNNLLSSIKPIKRLKSLKYLNVAINNLQNLDGIDECEKLNKLDFTLNFIPISYLKTLVETLAKLENLREIHFLGNPIADSPLYRKGIIWKCKQIVSIDGKNITKSERIEANSFDEKSFQMEWEMEVEREKIKEKETPATWTPEERTKNMISQENNISSSSSSSPHSVDISSPTATDPFQDSQKKLNAQVIIDSALDTKDNRPTQRNVGRNPFKLTENVSLSRYEIDISIPKYLDSNEIVVDVHTWWFQCIVKGKNLLLHLDKECEIHSVKVMRMTNMGKLLIYIKWERNQWEGEREKEKERGGEGMGLGDEEEKGEGEYKKEMKGSGNPNEKSDSSSSSHSPFVPFSPSLLHRMDELGIKADELPPLE